MVHPLGAALGRAALLPHHLSPLAAVRAFLRPDVDGQQKGLTPQVDPAVFSALAGFPVEGSPVGEGEGGLGRFHTRALQTGRGSIYAVVSVQARRGLRVPQCFAPGLPRRSPPGSRPSPPTSSTS